MRTWITSDLHFGHANVMKFCPKTRAHYNNDLTYMNETMIREWNEDIDIKDTVYILGDFAFTSGSDAAKIANRLNGRKVLVSGNHDVKTMRDVSFQKSFAEIHNSYHEINYNGNKIVMCHYPVWDHNGAGRGSLMLHGHRHGNPTGIPGRIMDVGMDATGKIATLLDDIIDQLKDVPHMYHHTPSTN